jgi:hypothetical protein
MAPSRKAARKGVSYYQTLDYMTNGIKILKSKVSIWFFSLLLI